MWPKVDFFSVSDGGAGKLTTYKQARPLPPFHFGICETVEKYRQNIVISLSTHGMIALTGSWGSGQACLAEEVIETFLTQPHSGVKIESASVFSSTNVSKVEGFFSRVEKNATVFVHLKDCIKNWHVDAYVKDIAAKLSDIQKNEKGRFVLITLTTVLWKKLNRHLTIPCHNLNDMGKNVRASIVNWHLKQYNIVDAETQPVSACTSLIVNKKYVKLNDLMKDQNEPAELGTLGLISILCKNPKIISNVESYVRNTYAYVVFDLEMMQTSSEKTEQCKFALLVYGMLQNGRFTIDGAKMDVINAIEKAYGLENSLDTYLKTFPSRNDCEYLDLGPDNNTCMIQNEFIVRILFRIVSDKHMKILIKHCDLNLLLDCLVVNDGLHKNCTLEIVNRFKKIETEGGIDDLENHVFFQDKTFKKLWSS